MGRIALTPTSLIIIFALIIISCTSTTLTTLWRDDSYSGHFKKVFVIGASENPAYRRMFEREFANQLKPHGIDTVPSHKEISSDRMLDKDTIVSKIKDMGIDAVLITRLIDKKTINRYRSENRYQPDWYHYYSRSYRYNDPYKKDELVSLETNLYDAGTERLVWSAVSDTVLMEGESMYTNIQFFIKEMVKKLSKENLL